MQKIAKLGFEICENFIKFLKIFVKFIHFFSLKISPHISVSKSMLLLVSYKSQCRGGGAD